MVICKSADELEKMHRAGLIVWGALEKMREMVRPGLTTKELDEFAEAYAAEHHARPAFKGYRGYPGSVCASINQEVVHGIPSKQRRVKEGDILSLDFGVEVEGYFGDEALTELLMIVSCYYGLALVVNAVDLEVDATARFQP